MSVLFIRLGIANKPVRSVLPEKQLLVFITGGYRPKVKSPSKTRGSVIKGLIPRAPKIIKVFARDFSRISTIKVVSVPMILRTILREPRD